MQKNIPKPYESLSTISSTTLIPTTINTPEKIPPFQQNLCLIQSQKLKSTKQNSPIEEGEQMCTQVSFPNYSFDADISIPSSLLQL